MNKEREYCGLKVFVSDELYNEYKGTLQEQIIALQQRIDKAIEYITNHTCWELSSSKVLEILKGDSNE